MGLINCEFNVVGSDKCENLWLLIARHSALQERSANDQVVRSLA